MKVKTLIALFIVSFIVYSCQVAPNNKGNVAQGDTGESVNSMVDTSRVIRDTKYYKSKGFQVFEDYGFAIKCPILLGDISNKMSGNFDFCYGGIENPNSAENFAMYQVLINNFPDGYRNATLEEKKRIEDKFLNNTFPGVKEKVIFEKMNAVVIKYQSNNMPGRSLMFIRGNKSYVFNLISNDNITARFNQLTNNIILLDNE